MTNSECEGAAEAIIEDGAIVIRVPIAHLPQVLEVLEGGWLCGSYDTRWRLTDIQAFAKDFVSEINREDELGSTRIHKMFDAAMAWGAAEQRHEEEATSTALANATRELRALTTQQDRGDTEK